MLCNNDERRPGTNQAASNVNGADEYQSTRCLDCGHLLTAEISVRVGRGPVCRERLGVVA